MFDQYHVGKKLNKTLIEHTVKPVHNGHPWDLKKWPFDRSALIKVRFILAVT
jgi:hypothetical protein